ncbi:MAG: acyl-CoA dehydrogenase family protein [Planctomycetota bacterium]|jgi:alkylation response protein AidB-like acyl-CoA dehydrogenase
MDFSDTPEEAAFRQECRSFLDAHAERLAPGERRMRGSDYEAAIADAKRWQATKADNGWACITWPKEYGGRGASAIENFIFSSEENKYRVPANMFTIGQGMLGPTIMALGTQKQKDRYLEKLLRGDEIWSQLFSEPAAGSDIGGLRTTAVRDGDDWVVNGQKIWTSGAHYSKWGMVLTRTDPTAAKHAGITYFIVDLESPGIEIRGIKQITGSSDFNEVFLTDVRIPDENRVGEVNDGWRGAITTLMNERATLSDQESFGLGIDTILKTARETEWNGKAAIEDSTVRQRIADMYVKLKGIEYTNYRSHTALSKGQTPGPENSIAKMIGAPLQQEMASFAVEILGLSGAVLDPGAAPFDGRCTSAWLSAPGLRLAGGTDEILRNIVAERVLGLPGEVRADKGVPFQDIPTGNH